MERVTGIEPALSAWEADSANTKLSSIRPGEVPVLLPPGPRSRASGYLWPTPGPRVPESVPPVEPPARLARVLEAFRNDPYASALNRFGCHSVCHPRGLPLIPGPPSRRELSRSTDASVPLPQAGRATVGDAGRRVLALRRSVRGVGYRRRHESGWDYALWDPRGHRGERQRGPRSVP